MNKQEIKEAQELVETEITPENVEDEIEVFNPEETDESA